MTIFIKTYIFGGREEGRKEGREEGRKGGREEGRKRGRKEGRKGGREEGRKGGREEGRKEGWRPTWPSNCCDIIACADFSPKCGIPLP